MKVMSKPVTKIAVICGHKSPFPYANEGKLANYGGASRFWESVIKHANETGYNTTHEFHIIGRTGSRTTENVANVHEVFSPPDRSIYRSEAYRYALSLNPTAIICEHPSLVPPDIADFPVPMFSRVVGYKYKGFIREGVHYFTNSNHGNRHYGQNWPVIHQTTLLDETRYKEKKNNYMIFMSNLTRAFKEKGLERAIRLSALSGKPLNVVGPWGDEGRKAHERLLYLISEYNAPVTYTGAVYGEQKAVEICSAFAALYPIDCPEMGSTFAIECAFSGTPMITNANGCMPEYVRDDETGYVLPVDATDEDYLDVIACAESATYGLDPADCFNHATKQFHPAKIARELIELVESKV